MYDFVYKLLYASVYQAGIKNLPHRAGVKIKRKIPCKSLKTVPIIQQGLCTYLTTIGITISIHKNKKNTGGKINILGETSP